MKRCSAPCVGHITKNQYAEDLIEAKNYLTSSDSQTIKRLEREIELFSNRLEFEKAATARDKLKRINLIQEEQSVTTKAKDIDIFSVAEDSGYLGICTVVVRKGKIRGTKTQLVKKIIKVMNLGHRRASNEIKYIRSVNWGSSNYLYANIFIFWISVNETK